MNAFVVCAFVELVGVVLAGEAFEDRLALLMPSRTYLRDFLLSLQYNNNNKAVEMEIPSSLCLHRRKSQKSRRQV